MLVLDHSRFPIIIANWSGPPTTEDIEILNEGLEHTCKRAQASRVKVIQIHDSSHAEAMSPVVRKALADGMVVRSEEYRDVIAAVFVVAPTPLLRGMVTALRWAGTDETISKIRLCDSLLEAMDSAQKLQQDHRIRA